ncbi:hypothetical protein RFN28_13865 [Mesorhizobium sp. VK24D]|uniref:Uncharacterized protein n=1 Tax=Mesorhizobium album TaxID=3072314 RepID=A0ABU4Y0Z1_9HYPH|nr:hypothetical protein [Mesorhizobium sp. VK24D]MDX8479559.1 hypothetical protein [Mesorhizobium sp. VK24D]
MRNHYVTSETEVTVPVLALDDFDPRQDETTGHRSLRSSSRDEAAKGALRAGNFRRKLFGSKGSKAGWTTNTAACRRLRFHVFHPHRSSSLMTHALPLPVTGPQGNWKPINDLGRFSGIELIEDDLKHGAGCSSLSRSAWRHGTQRAAGETPFLEMELCGNGLEPEICLLNAMGEGSMARCS